MHILSVILAWFALAPRRCAPACALLAGLGMAGAAQADTYHFNGKAVTGCTLSGTVYTCPVTSLPNEYDRVIIDSGITVNAQSDISFRYNQGLTMSGTARLTSTGNINIADIATNNLNVSGGSISAGKTFTVGNQVQTVTADISAGSMVLGSGSTLRLNGTLVSSGAVQIASNTTINGPVRGTVITTSSPFTIRGDITATSRFTLASGGTVNGNITAPVTELFASGSVVTGKVTALTSLVLGSGTTVNGDVDTGQLRLEASNALISGNASVDFAYLQWAGRVSKKIYCKSGTRTGYCDCVDNQSGWAVNTANGPTCEAAKPAAGTLHHFLITHDGEGRTCAPETVTVTACANQACTELFKDGANVTLSPGGTLVKIGNSGVQTAEVSRSTAGSVTLALSQNGNTPATACYNSSNKSASCGMTFVAGMSFVVTVPDFKAGTAGIQATIKALDTDEKTGVCVAALKGQTRPVQYSCGYESGTNDSAGMTLGGAARACNGAASAINSAFDQKGETRIGVGYQDVGKLKLLAKLDDAEGSASFVVAPDRFDFTSYPATPSTPVRAGDAFEVGVRALNVQGNVTPSFDKARLGAGATATGFAVSCVAKGVAGALIAKPAEFDRGTVRASMSWGEVGTMNLRASLEKFLDSALTVSGTTGAGGDTSNCAPKVGPFIPKYFRVEQPATPEVTARQGWFYYAGEPVPVRVSAMNAQGGITSNYASALKLSEKVTLTAFDDAAKVQNPGGGQLLNAVLPDTAFADGVATAAPTYWPAADKPVAVQNLRLRATNARTEAALLVTSIDADGKYEVARPAVKSGRLRLGNVFGRVNQPLTMRIEAQYWTGESWLANTSDSITTISAKAFAQAPVGKGGPAPGPIPITAAQTLKNGAVLLPVTGNRTGWIDVALNLGNDATLLACRKDPYPSATEGAKLAWLRVRSGCLDPSARATFGEQAPENRRMIHVREVFN